jgi:hypothetical protein
MACAQDSLASIFVPCLSAPDFSFCTSLRIQSSPAKDSFFFCRSIGFDRAREPGAGIFHSCFPVRVRSGQDLILPFGVLCARTRYSLLFGFGVKESLLLSASVFPRQSSRSRP